MVRNRWVELLFRGLDPIRGWLGLRREWFPTRGRRVLDLGAGRIRRGNLTLDRDPSARPDVRGEASRLPFAGESVDDVVCYHLVEHLTPARARRLAREMHRVLRPGGGAFVLVDRDRSEAALFAKDPDHVHRYTPREAREIFGSFFAVEALRTGNVLGNLNRYGWRFFRHLDERRKVYLELRKPAGETPQKG